MSWLKSLTRIDSKQIKSGQAVTVRYTLTDPSEAGDALAITGADGYEVAPETVALATGSTTGTFDVTVIGDPGVVRVRATLNDETHGVTVEIIS